MERFMFKRNWRWALVVLLVLGLGAFVLLGPKAPPEPIKVYKAVTPAPKATQTDAAETANLSDAQTQPASDAASVPPVPEAIDAQPMPEAETISEMSPETTETEASASNAAEPEKLYFGDYTEEELVQIRDWGKNLDARLLEKYPEFAEITRMTPEEIAQKYPTDEDRIQLVKRGQEFLNEYTEEMGAFLVTLPEPIRRSLLNDIHSELSKNWGRKAADQTMEKIADLMK